MRFRILLVWILAAACAGCAHKPESPLVTSPELNRQSIQAMDDDYIIQRGDVLDVKFFYNSELNEHLVVRPDGRISMVGIDDIQAAGLTPSQLDDQLTAAFSKRVAYPDITVIMREFTGRSAYVGGEVANPGLVPLQGKITALQAIMQAGGFKNTGDMKCVVLLRKQTSLTPMFVVLDLNADLRDPSQHNDILIQPFDIVFVPKTTIAVLNEFVAQYIDKLIPVSRMVGFNWVYDLNPNNSNQ
ncbi:MAG: polysaccharide biosynthesis/export family protein [Syntrophobacteraceae bacterium]